MTDNEFRVTRWQDYVGQTELKTRLDIHINSALQRGADRLDHIFLHGPSGSGKTSLAGIIAKRFGRPFKKYIMPLDDAALKKMVVSTTGVILLDEIHRCSPRQQERFLTLLEDQYLATAGGQIIENPTLTIIGATTDRGKIIKPLYDRFLVKPEFVPYTDAEMTTIARGMIRKAELKLPSEFAKAFATAAGGVPRHIADLVTMARDLEHAGADVTVDAILQHCSTTKDGLSKAHLEYLDILQLTGMPIGLDMLSTRLRLGKSVVLDLERLLTERAWIEYSKSGRELTTTGFARIQKESRMT